MRPIKPLPLLPPFGAIGAMASVVVMRALTVLSMCSMSLNIDHTDMKHSPKEIRNPKGTPKKGKLYPYTIAVACLEYHVCIASPIPCRGWLTTASDKIVDVQVELCLPLPLTLTLALPLNQSPNGGIIPFVSYTAVYMKHFIE